MRFFTFIFASSVGHAALPVTDGHWLPLHKGGVAIADVAEDDVDDNLDIVGDDSFPAGFWTIDDENLYVRIRLVASPEHTTLEGGLSGTNVENGWGVLVNQDENLTDYEILAAIDQNGTSIRIQSEPAGPGWMASPTASI